MGRSRRRLPFAAVAAVLAAGAAVASDITIYRCTDANGHLTLRDTPCRAGEKQQSREMVRPKDPPSRPAAAPRSAPVADERTDAPDASYPQLLPRKPFYECITPDGELYVSETGEGRPRWQPLWVSGYPVGPYPRPRPDMGGRYSGRIDYDYGHGGGRGGGGMSIGGTARIGDRPPGHAPVVPFYSTGSWVRDECYALPQDEVCDRLRDQRYELNRRWQIAQPSERAQLDLQTRGIDARLANDCGGG